MARRVNRLELLDLNHSPEIATGQTGRPAVIQQRIICRRATLVRKRIFLLLRFTSVKDRIVSRS